MLDDFPQSMHVTVIINPISGRQRRPETARHRVALAQQVLTAAAITHEVKITERPGHAYEFGAGGSVARCIPRLCMGW